MHFGRRLFILKKHFTMNFFSVNRWLYLVLMDLTFILRL